MPDEQAVPTADNQEQPAVPSEPAVSNEAEQVKQMPNLDDLPYDLDLDLIAPQPKRVKVGSKVYTINPPKVHEMIRLYKLAGILEGTPLADAEKPTQDIIDAIKALIPDFEAEDDLSLIQIWMLFGFITTMVNPVENSALKALGLEPTEEKKIPAA